MFQVKKNMQDMREPFSWTNKFVELSWQGSILLTNLFDLLVDQETQS